MSETPLTTLRGPALISRERLQSAAASGGLRTRAAAPRRAPLITVITIVFNGGEALAGTIRSVLAQGVDGLEYLIIDGGSSDPTLNVIRSFEDKLEYWASEKDAGIADAFNKGLSLARGEVIGIINAGDVYEPGALAAVAATAAEDRETDVFYGRVRYLGPAGAFVLSPDHSQLKDKMSLSHPGCFVRLSAYKKYGVFDTGYAIAMDYELLLRFYLGGAKFRPLGVLAATMDMEGVSNTKWLAAIREAARAKRKLQGAVKASSYFAAAVFWKLAIDAMEKLGFASLLDVFRARRANLKRTKCD